MSEEKQIGATNGDANLAGGDGDAAKKPSDDDRKLFIGGISWDTEQKDLKEYFAKYGEVTEVNIKTDAVTGKCRGFGFITFANKEAVDNVLNNVPHTIKGKQIDPKRAKARPGLKKIFVGGLDTSLSEADIRGHFEKYGKIEQIEQPFDKVRNQKRQFCFITFESEEVVEEACKQAKQKVGSKECDVKKATIKSEGRGGRSYGRGGSRGRGARNASGAYGGNANWSSSMYGQAGYGYGQGYGYSGYSSYDYPGYSSGYGSGYGSGFDYSAGWGYGSGQGYGTGYSQQPASYGKARSGAVSSGGGGGGGASRYHPYGR